MQDAGVGRTEYKGKNAARGEDKNIRKAQREEKGAEWLKMQDTREEGQTYEVRVQEQRAGDKVRKRKQGGRFYYPECAGWSGDGEIVENESAGQRAQTDFKMCRWMILR